MRKSTSDLIWGFIVLCNGRKAVKKFREYEGWVTHDFDEWVVAAICEYQARIAQNNHGYVAQHRNPEKLEERQRRLRDPRPMASRLCLQESLEVCQDTPKGAANNP